jgi:two-component system phosphate regulon sensor histidine kinase PhoR
MIAHDMRSLLQAMSLSARGAIEAGNNPEIVRMCLNRIEKNVQALSHMVDTILEVAPDGWVELKKTECDPAALIASAIDQIAPILDRNQLRTRVSIPPVAPILTVDGPRITRVLVNLLSNAARFSPESGEIEISIKGRANDGNPAVIFSVSDNGPGVDPEDINRIFLSGVSLGHGDLHSTGLGLTICREIIEAHAGKIWVETGRVKGATFSFSLPLSREQWDSMSM